MAERQSPTVRKRRLVARMVAARSAAGLSQEDAAEIIHVNPSSMSRMETGLIAFKPLAVEKLTEKYGMPVAEADHLVQLAKDAKQRGWWQVYKDVLSSEYADFIGFETEAAITKNYELDVIPGLLQTREYAEALITAQLPEASTKDIERRVALRIARQDRLRLDPPIRIWALLGEAALRYQVGGSKVINAQLEHLLSVSNEPHITIQVLPFSAGAHPGMAGPFVILGFEQDPDIVYQEGLTSALYLEESEQVARYTLMFEHLLAAALSPTESRTKIAEIRSNP